MLYYANPDWTPADGGCLRLHLPQVGAVAACAPKASSAAAQGTRDIQPQGDRLVIFLRCAPRCWSARVVAMPPTRKARARRAALIGEISAWLWHEVLPANKSRFSLTTWFY